MDHTIDNAPPLSRSWIHRHLHATHAQPPMNGLGWYMSGFLLLALLLQTLSGCAAPAPRSSIFFDPDPGVTTHLRGVGWVDPIRVGSLLELSSGVTRCSAVAISAHEALSAAHCNPADMSIDPKAFQLSDAFGHKFAVSSIEMPTQPAHDVMRVRIVDAPREDGTGGGFTSWSELSADLPTAGALVYVAGYGCGKALDIRPAVYFGASEDFWHDVILDGYVCLGDSGGALLDGLGRVFGLVRARPAAGAMPIVYGTPTQTERWPWSAP